MGQGFVLHAAACLIIFAIFAKKYLEIEEIFV